MQLSYRLEIVFETGQSKIFLFRQKEGKKGIFFRGKRKIWRETWVPLGSSRGYPSHVQQAISLLIIHNLFRESQVNYHYQLSCLVFFLFHRKMRIFIVTLSFMIKQRIQSFKITVINYHFSRKKLENSSQTLVIHNTMKTKLF